MKLKVVWRYIYETDGVQFVMISGVLKMPMWCATNWDFWVPLKQYHVQDLVRVVDPFYWIMYGVWEMRVLLLTVQLGQLASTIVSILKMQESGVTLAP